MLDNVPYFLTEGHQYTTPDGTPLESVTSILKSGLGLYQYKKVSNAALFGTNCHKAFQYYDEKDLVESTLDPAVEIRLEQYKLALTNEEIEIQQNEVMRYHPIYLYAGCIDKVCKVKGVQSLIDIKTGKVEAWHGLQLAAYGELVKEEVRAEKHYCLYVQDDTYQLIDVTNEKYFKYFLSLMTSSHIKKELGY